MGLWRAGRRAAAPLLEVTTETQARNTQPFLPLGTAGLASRAMAGWEPSSARSTLPVCLSAPVESSTQVPRPGVTRMAVIPAPMTGRARNSRLSQATRQPRTCGWGSVLSRARASSSSLFSRGEPRYLLQHPENLPPSTLPVKRYHPQSERWQAQVTEVNTGLSQCDHQVGVSLARGCWGCREAPHFLQSTASFQKPSLPLGPHGPSSPAPRHGISF